MLVVLTIVATVTPAVPTPADRTGAGFAVIAHAAPGAADLDQQIVAAAGQLEVVVEQYDGLRENLAATQRQMAALTQRMLPMRRGLIDEQDKLAAMVASVYQTTTIGTLDLLLEAGSPVEALDQLTALERMAQERDQAVAALLSAQARYDQQRRTLDALARQLESQRGELDAKRAAITVRIRTLSQLRVTAYGSAGPRMPAGPVDADDIPTYSANPAGRAVRFAYRQIGRPYEWGSSGPAGFDCSGLVLAAWHVGGVGLPHNSVMQWNAVAHVPREMLRPGDLVFYFDDIHHVALYVGYGKVIHAPQYGETVTLAALDMSPVYGYGRPR